MALQAKAMEYFGSINTMASRLTVDLQEAITQHKDQLENLPLEEQQQLLSDMIVTPQVLTKYPQHELEESTPKYAVKMIVDDHYCYRDEHSGPFSFHTASQRDLSCMNRKKPIKRQTKYGNKGPAPVPPIKTVISAQPDNNQVKHRDSAEISIKLDYDLDEDTVDSSVLTGLLPKTGLDLLDNW